jgi:signal transduction histidine kinase/ActR/RegA family two-component response regulator
MKDRADTDHQEQEKREQNDELYLAQLQEMNNRLLDTQRELLRANRKVTEATKEKDRFLAKMSHDMRTPLNAIMSFNELLLETLPQDTPELLKARQYVQYSNASARFLLSLIGDILDFSKIEQGTMTLAADSFPLSECVNSAASMIRPLADSKRQHFEFENSIPAGNYYIGDKTRVLQVLMNLLNNAVKFTPSEGCIHLSASLDHGTGSEDTAVFEISDTGIGMSPDFQKRMFQAFSQENSSGLAGTAGAGLGLSIAKRVVDAMGGTIFVKSQPGEGTTFTIKLPFLVSAGKDTAALCKEHYTFQGLHVLVCDDNELNRLALSELLKVRGCEVQEACNGEEALSLFRDSPNGYYQAVFMDVRMPVMDGYQSTMQIRALDRPDAACIIIFAMTADAAPDDIRKSAEAGMNGHLTKPIDLEQLYSQLDKVYKNSHPRNS